MIKIITCSLLLALSTLSIAQFANARTSDDVVRTPVAISPYLNLDFSSLILAKQIDKRAIVGAIGNNYQRLCMGIKSVKNLGNGHYQITGMSKVKHNLTNFTGTLTLSKVALANELDYGVDDEYKSAHITKQGVAVFDYLLNENSAVKYSGKFTGKMSLYWYQTADNKLHYDDIDYNSDSHQNRVYAGNWKEYATGKTKLATWGDYRMDRKLTPNLDIGAGGFSPNSDYAQNGWQEPCSFE